VSVAAIILAAGESRRMGSPKAFLPFRGGTFLSTLVETLAICCDPVYAVFGFEAQRFMKNVPAPAIAVENANYREGMLTSLQAGLRAIPELPERILFTLVDHPAVQPETVSRLLAIDGTIVMPRYSGKRGHPVVLSRAMAREIMAEPVSSKLNEIMNRHAAEIRYVEVDDSGIRDDIDDPRQYEELLAREGACI
jgi:molybdenum cofactor cytidylyltransferase